MFRKLRTVIMHELTGNLIYKNINENTDTMTWVITTGSDETFEFSDEELLQYLQQMTGRDPSSLNDQLQKLKNGSSSDSAYQLIDTITSLGISHTSQIYDYFTNPSGGGYSWYQSFSSTIDKLLIDFIKQLDSDKYTFEKPYTRKELSLLWVAYNFISEILGWLSRTIRGKLSNSTRGPGLVKPAVSFILDLSSIIVAIKIQELTQNDIYSHVMELKDKWGFLIHDMNEQIISQLMAVLMDTGAIVADILGDTKSFLANGFFSAGELGDALYHLKFMEQSIEGMIAYSNSEESTGWIAGMVQELGFIQDNDLTSGFLGIQVPVPYDLIFDLLMVMIMGDNLYHAT